MAVSRVLRAPALVNIFWLYVSCTFMELLVIYFKVCLTIGIVKRWPKSAFTAKNLCFVRYVNMAREDHAVGESNFYRVECHILDVAGFTSSDWCLVEIFI